jgi:hypothetical protein
LCLSVFAINGLYTALGSPGLPNWTTNGGDPCNEAWQGVECVNSNITSMYDQNLCVKLILSIQWLLVDARNTVVFFPCRTLSGANLGGQLGNTLANFTSLITL